ncbi:MAG: DUF4065 domain-containing protein [Rubrivivax sp.]|nr:MAG: DUF4065 domain-containing protein [Rubrivivax sp.]
MRKADPERLVNSAYLFLEEMGPCSAKKLFKLLYVLDVTHFQRTGTTVTGVEYCAGDFGPYPHELSQQLGDGAVVAGVIASEKSEESGEREIVLLAPDAELHFSDRQFSRLQLKLIESLRTQYANATYGLIDVAAVDNGAWKKALQKKKHNLIRMEDAVNPDTEEGAATLAQAAFLQGRAERWTQLRNEANRR